jgi:hypothetical protein
MKHKSEVRKLLSFAACVCATHVETHHLQLPCPPVKPLPVLLELPQVLLVPSLPLPLPTLLVILPLNWVA